MVRYGLVGKILAVVILFSAAVALPIGFHSLVIDVTARKNALSSGYKVWIDAIEDDPPWTNYTNEILMVRLDGGEIRRLAHHRSRPFKYLQLHAPRISQSRRRAARICEQLRITDRRLHQLRRHLHNDRAQPAPGSDGKRDDQHSNPDVG